MPFMPNARSMRALTLAPPSTAALALAPMAHADPAYVVAIGYAADAFLALGALRQRDLGGLFAATVLAYDPRVRRLHHR